MNAAGAEDSSTAEVVRRIVEENLGVYRASAGRLQEDVSQEAQVASDYRGPVSYTHLTLPTTPYV